MLIKLTQADLADAVNHHLLSEYGLRVDVNPSQFTELELNIPSKGQKDFANSMQKNHELSEAYQELKASNVEEDVKALEEDVDREAVLERAEELGISYRSDIKTTTLIQRIEDEEIRLAKAIEKDSMKTTSDYEYASDVEETPEPPEEPPLNDDDDLLQEVPPKKKSIFERD